MGEGAGSDALLWEAGEDVEGGGPGPVPGMVTHFFMHSRGCEDTFSCQKRKGLEEVAGLYWGWHFMEK